MDSSTRVDCARAVVLCTLKAGVVLYSTATPVLLSRPNGEQAMARVVAVASTIFYLLR